MTSRNSHNVKKDYRRKLNKLRNVIHSNSNDEITILSDAVLCISATKEKIEELQKELEAMDQVEQVEHQVASPSEVKVEKLGKNRFMLNVMSPSEEGKDYQALIKKAFEEKEIQFINICVSRYVGFKMEAIVKVTQPMNLIVLTEVVLNAIEN